MDKAEILGTARSDAGDIDDCGLGDAVFVISRDGVIRNVIRQPDEVSTAAGEIQPGTPAGNVWPGGFAKLVHDNVKRTLRDRQVHVAEFSDESNRGHYEVIAVAQAPDRALVVIRDVSAKKTEISEIQQLAYVDDATGLPNREYLLKELDRITTALRLNEGRAAIIRFHISQIELAESASGRHNQNEILQILSTRLTSGLRGVNQTDTEDEERYSIVARVDHRQFAVVLPIIQEGADAQAVAARLAESMEQPIAMGSREITVSASAGIALYPQDGTDAQTLYENAGAATTDAKNSLTTRQKLHSGTIKVRALDRQDLELELKSALARDEFELNFMPIVLPDSRKAISIEALLRWPQTVLGAKSTQKLISLAEYTGLIVPIGEWVLRRSCENLAGWHAAGHEELRLAVNLSVQEFSRPDLVERMAAILEECSIDPALIDAEITEHILFRDAMRDFVMCKELKSLGVKVVVDDYGTGACSLAHLSRSPIDAIKIDGSFVAQLGVDPAQEAACAAATAMAHALDLQVVAECVETEEQAAKLQALGCDLLQGFLFGNPAQADEIGSYLGAAESETDGGND